MDVGASPNQAPDWQQLDIAVHCPRCGYNLYMMTTPRCPECGLRFEWDRIIAAARHPRFPPFEYTWRNRPIRAFLATVTHAMFPRRLWRRAQSSAAPRTRPLLSLVPLTLLLFALSWFAGLVVRRWAIFYCFKWWGDLSLRGFLVSIGWESLFFLLFGAALWGWTLLLPYTLAPRQLPRARLWRIVVLSWVGLVMWRATMVILIYLALVVVVGMLGLEWPRHALTLLELVPLAVLLMSLYIGLRSYQRRRQAFVTALLIMALALFVVTWCVIMLGPLSPVRHSVRGVASAAEAHWPLVSEGVLTLLRWVIIITG